MSTYHFPWHVGLLALIVNINDSHHLLGTYDEPDTVLSALPILTILLILTITLWDTYSNLVHFLDKETKCLKFLYRTI